MFGLMEQRQVQRSDHLKVKVTAKLYTVKKDDEFQLFHE